MRHAACSPACLLVAALLVSGAIASAQPPGPPPGQPPGPRAPARDQRTPAQTGTAIVRGRVLAADTGRPLRRARITLTAPELGGEPRTTSTGMDGRYEVAELPAGRYAIRVVRSGYLPLLYGQRRPLEQGKPLQVLDKQAVENIDFALPRSSVIRGQIVDELSEPVADVPVFAMRSTVTENGVQQVMGYAPTYFPGTASLTDARRVTVVVGQDAVNTNFALMPGRAANISGTAVDSLGRPLVSRPVSLLQEMAGPNGGVMMMGGNAMTAADGSFLVKNVSPGQYKMRTQTIVEGKTPQSSVQEVATLPISLDGADITGVALTTSSGWSISGRVTTENGGPPDGPRDRFRLAWRVVDIDTSPIPGVGLPPPPPGGGPSIPDSGRVREDWTFMVTNAYGASRLYASLPDGWAVKTILHDGRDITDTPVEMKSGEELTGVHVIVTNRVTDVSGQLADEKGAPLVDGTVVLFADDSSKWSEDSRWVRAVRPDQQGRYQIRGLPPGEYFAVAVSYAEDGIWNDPEYLDAIRRYAEKVTLGESAAQSLSLKLVTP